MSSLPQAPKPDIMELLVRAKAFIDHAVTHAQGHAPLDGMIAVHNLDNGVEYMLRIILRHLDIEATTGKTLDTSELSQLAGEINKYLKHFCGIDLPYMQEIKLLRQTRNLIQHGMVNPLAELPNLINITQKFFDRNLRAIFGLTLNEIRYSSAINRKEIKENLKLAEDLIDEGKYLEAIVASRDAFENALFSKKDSFLDILVVPALLELKNEYSHLYSYVKALNAKFGLDTLGIDARLYKRFEDYLSHIPNEYRVDQRGSLVMQRPWNKEDALFCCNFVSEIVFKWESAEMEPLYIPKPLKNKYTFVEKIGSTELKHDFEGGCYYSIDFENDIDFFYANETTMNQIKNQLQEKNIYQYSMKSLKDDFVELEITKYCMITAIDYALVTNNPVRWGIMIWMQTIPLTYCRTRYSGGNISEHPLDINTCTLEELIQQGISETAAKKIVGHFRENIIISDVSQLASTGGISDNDRRKIANNFFSKPMIDSLI